MPQSTRRWISEEVQSLRDSNVLPFHDLLDADLVQSALAEEGVTSHECTYTPPVTLCVFLSQVLDPDHSCRAAVARLIVWLAVNGRKPCAPDTSSSCEARLRLPEGGIVRLVRETARRAEGRASDAWLWKGRRVTSVDGTTASMPDTSANQGAFPRSNAQGIGLGFPLVRLVALISLATGLRCKTPEIVRKEIRMHVLAYNLIRGVMTEAAEVHAKRPRQLSFKGALQTMTAFQDALRWATPGHRVHLVGAMLKAISCHEVGDRFGRVEPRANKRRPKPQRYLTEPRSQARKRLMAAA